LITLINNNPGLENLSMNHRSCSGNLIFYVFNHLKCLASLELTGTGFGEVSTEELERLDFGLLINLHTLDLSASKSCNKIVAKILQNCESLKKLDISACKELTDDMFKVQQIRAPIQDLDLSFSNVCLIKFSCKLLH
jgi:hypothetical protein